MVYLEELWVEGSLFLMFSMKVSMSGSSMVLG